MIDKKRCWHLEGIDRMEKDKKELVSWFSARLPENYPGEKQEMRERLAEAKRYLPLWIALHRYECNNDQMALNDIDEFYERRRAK